MFSRNFQQSATSGTGSSKLSHANAGCKCCAAIRRARKITLFDPIPECCSPLTPGVQLVNLSYGEDQRTIRAQLGNDWPRMFAQLPAVGPGLVMTRNDAAILGRRMAFPSVAFTSDGLKGANAESGLWLNFHMFYTARAIHIRSGEGNIFGVEFGDVQERMIHRFTLTSASDPDVFFDWARLHQACSAHSNLSRLEAYECDPANMKNRTGYCNGNAGALPALLKACEEREIAVQATVRSCAVVQRALFVPTSVTQVDDWWFASDNTVGLHFQPEKFIGAEIVEQINCFNPQPRLLLHTDNYESALVLEAGDYSIMDSWRNVLYSFASPRNL